jgi:murein peptide amidase A
VKEEVVDQGDDPSFSWRVHSAHNYAVLIKRWRGIARLAGLHLEELVRTEKARTFFLRTKTLGFDNGIYISAGIHGDEAAGTEALVTWAEKHAAGLNAWPLLLFPCLNPWGLVNNCRYDANGVDLNRVFHTDAVPTVRQLKKVIESYEFALALMLHEDFDGQGLYLYEVQRDRPFWGEEILQAARKIIPIEGRGRIEGRKAVAGLIRRRFDAKRFAMIGYPEAIWLHLHHARHALTIETPSEFALDQRVQAHVAIIEECVRRVMAASAAG